MKIKKTTKTKKIAHDPLPIYSSAYSRPTRTYTQTYSQWAASR